MAAKIAVCIQAYNEEKFIAETIQSILNQTFTEFDLIISDNHSTDATAKIISDFKSQDSRIISWMPRSFCKSLEHARFMIDKVNDLDYDSTIFIGAHDLIEPRYIELLHSAYQANPTAAMVVGSGVEIDTNGGFLRQWPNVIQLKGGHVSSRPLTILMNLYYNLAAFALWPKSTRTRVKFRHDCMCSDHLYIAEASLCGDIVVEEKAIIQTRRTVGVGEHATYFKKHISDDMQVASVVSDFERQMEWICHIYDMAYAGFPEATRNITLAGALGIYFSLFGITTLRSVDGALESWLASPSGLAIASQMSAIGSSVRLSCMAHRV